MMNREAKANFSLQFISHTNGNTTYLDGIRMALEGGCRWIQLRMKEATDEEARQTALEAQAMCKEYGATFIIDDRVMLAHDIKADGVHLGKKDMPVSEARQILGRQAIIGGTANTIEDIKRLCEAEADYIGCGPFRFTTTKQGLAPIIGLEGYRSIMRQMANLNLKTPLVAIGGITAEDIPDLMATGISGIAISGTVLSADDPAAEMRRLLSLTEGL